MQKEQLNQNFLYKLEDKCTQEKPPAAQGWCPIHIPCKSICEAISAKDFDSAKEIYLKHAPLPHTLSALCTGMCKEECVRKDYGDAIDMPFLERALMKFGNAKEKRIFIPKRKEKVLIIGGGITGLAAALELGKKGYFITIFERNDKLGGGVLESERFNQHDLNADLKMLEQFNITIELNREVTEPFSYSREYDAVFYACGKDLKGVKVNSVTLETDIENFFIGGNSSREKKDIVLSICDAKKASITIERHLKKVSITSEREKEGSIKTPLVTDTTGATIKNKAENFELTTESAILEAKRCLNCQCMLCVKSCAFMSHYKAYPKKYLREIYNNLSIAMGSRLANQMINSCSLCGQCEAVCINGLNLGEFIQRARNEMVKSNHMPQSAFYFALQDMQYSNGENYFLSRNQYGYSSSEYLYFPGCQLGAAAPNALYNSYVDLTKTLKGGVGLMLGCCAVMAKWSGEEALFTDSIQKIRSELLKYPNAKIILACPTCMSVFAEHLSEFETVGIWEILKKQPLRNTKKVSDEIVIHDACGARKQPEIMESIRDIVKDMGYTVKEKNYNKEKSLCCGFGGLAEFSNRAVSDEMAVKSMDRENENYLCYCINCKERFNKNNGKAYHLLELIYSDDTPFKSFNSYGEKRDNRFNLKRKLLENLWNEEQSPIEEGIKILFKENSLAALDEKMILKQDIEAVIVNAERTNRRIYDKTNNFFISGRQIGDVTFWVHYSIEGDAFTVENAYFHRMSIKEESP